MGLLDLVKLGDRDKRMLAEHIAHNADVIEKSEGKTRKDAEYLAICLILDDLQTRPKGRSGYLKVMDLLRGRYHEHHNDVITYLAWSNDRIHLKPDAEAALRNRHEKGGPEPAPPATSFDLVRRPQTLYHHTAHLIGLQTAILTYATEYWAAVRAGKVKCPAIERKHADPDFGVHPIWRDTRTEALSELWNSGQYEGHLLGNLMRSDIQADLMGHVIAELAGIETGKPVNEAHAVNVRAVQRVYRYLSHAGSEVCDPLTDRCTLECADKKIFDDLVSHASRARGVWARLLTDFEGAKREAGGSPPTLLEIVFSDVTAKSKSIAMSATLGPNYEANLMRLLQGKMDRQKIDAQLQFFRDATEPNDLLAT
jgi:hypothetical protein